MLWGTARARPSGLLIVDYPSVGEGAFALLAGTVSGVFVAWPAAGEAVEWTRLGSCAQFPLVMTKGLSYEVYSDTLVAATMGRGAYVLSGAKKALLNTRVGVNATAVAGVTSSAKYFPKQK